MPMGISHKPLMAKIEKQFHLSMNDKNYLAKEHILKPNMDKNDDQPTIDGFKIFSIVENIKTFEFPRQYYDMTFSVQNLFWICGSHQNLILIKWLMRSYEVLNICEKMIGDKVENMEH